MKRFEGIVSEIPVVKPSEPEVEVKPVELEHESSICYVSYSNKTAEPAFDSYYVRKQQENARIAKHKRTLRLESALLKVGIMLAVIISGSGLAYNAMKHQATAPVEWVKVAVQPGDTTWNLVQDYNAAVIHKYDVRDLISAFEKHNHRSSNLVAGEVIEVPIMK